MWNEWVNGFLGVWLVLLAMLGVLSTATVLVTGAIIAILGFWGVIRERQEYNSFTYRRDFGLYAE